jgi:GT2 family glycosyltransferase
MPARSGAAACRNAGAKAATGDIIWFLDADVVLHEDLSAKIRERFAGDPKIGALMGSYAPDTPRTNFLSVYKNLFHHFTHQTALEDASTFWTGCGAIRKDLFRKVNGFDEDYKSASIEDIELGYRLNRAGIPISLAKDIQVCHLKRYSFGSLIRSDLFCRAVPWTKIMIRKRIFRNDLNTKTYHIASTALTYLIPVSLAAGIFVRPMLWLPPLLFLVFLFLNRDFLGFLKKAQGFVFAVKSSLILYLGYFYSGLGFLLGAGKAFLEWRQEKKKAAL